MTKKKVALFIATFMVIVIGVRVFGTLPQNNKNSPFSDISLAKKVKKNKRSSKKMNQYLKIKVGKTVLTAKLADNSSAKALSQKLQKKSLTLRFHDFGNFEKVGDLPWSLPQNNEQMTTKPGDITLYQGNQLSLYYDHNSWSLTKIARIINSSQSDLKNILGKKDVTVKLAL
ncbi:cyclophilin-like fold protein [Lactobacillus xylocopicola]|uniref:Cyclophilin-like domain-containing protein n=1 Tax=Lactobacillus xylocopicola TaxID=2976676 RepID=A0ABM8BF23_9LACO|nr:cyclophilin-like fold protein [Lactobacillus xylocopicola]BDR59793.1 hypothetical protein KIM322_00540 [Lactobacillus xylocopicola]